MGPQVADQPQPVVHISEVARAAERPQAVSQSSPQGRLRDRRVADGRVLHPVPGGRLDDANRVSCSFEELFHFGGRQVDEVFVDPPDPLQGCLDPSVHGRLSESEVLSDLNLWDSLQEVASQDVCEVRRDPLQESIDSGSRLLDPVRVRSRQPRCLSVDSIDVSSEWEHDRLYWGGRLRISVPIATTPHRVRRVPRTVLETFFRAHSLVPHRGVGPYPKDTATGVLDVYGSSGYGRYNPGTHGGYTE